MKSLYKEFNVEIVNDAVLLASPQTFADVDIANNNNVSFLYQGNLTTAITFTAEESEDGITWTPVEADYLQGDLVSGTGALVGLVHVISGKSHVRLIGTDGTAGDTCNITAIKVPIQKG